LGVVAVALGLGLGLGLGLHKNNHNNNLENSNSTTPVLQTWQQDPQEYSLNISWNNQAPNTTRYYTFNLTEIPNGAPDGVEVRMLLINGKFPGPVIEANEGDRLIVTINNFMTLPTAFHWHGQYQNGNRPLIRDVYCRFQFHGRDVRNYAMSYCS